MSRNGQLALKKVVITYGVTTGAPGVRQALSREVFDFKKQYPSVQVEIRPRRVADFSITGHYRDGSELSLALDQKHPDGKSMSSQGIWYRLQHLATTANVNNLPHNPRTWHMQRTSIQGTWNPWLWAAESHESREPPARFDRKLTDEEWDYYVDRYTQEMKNEEGVVQQTIKRQTEPTQEHTKRIAQRWDEYVAPTRQTDLEHNLAAMKAKAKKRKASDNSDDVTLKEYSLFHVPNFDMLGKETLSALRGKEQVALAEWWQKRKEQLKPPE